VLGLVVLAPVILPPLELPPLGLLLVTPVLAVPLVLAWLLEWLVVVFPVVFLVPLPVVLLVVLSAPELLAVSPVVSLPWLEFEPTVPLELALPIDWLLVGLPPLDAEGPGLTLPETGQPLKKRAPNSAPATPSFTLAVYYAPSARAESGLGLSDEAARRPRRTVRLVGAGRGWYFT
jgi:hypothetical protein